MQKGTAIAKKRKADCPVLRNQKIGRELVRKTTREVFQYYAIISLIT